ncbi:hypothetical protein ACFPRL_20935 [Pseudoclavibacter helvolus]
MEIREGPRAFTWLRFPHAHADKQDTRVKHGCDHDALRHHHSRRAGSPGQPQVEPQ